MFSFGYSFFLSGPIIGYTSLSYFYIFSIVFYMIHYFDTIAKHPFLVALQIHSPYCFDMCFLRKERTHGSSRYAYRSVYQQLSMCFNYNSHLFSSF